MPNIAKVFKDEIARISRREAKAAFGGIGKANTGLKRIVASLKKRVAFLEKENRRLTATMKKIPSPQTSPEETQKIRLTSRGIRSLRNRLRLTQAEFGRLMGTTPHSVYLWERKEGALKLRDKTKAALLSIRGLRAREAKEKLAEMTSKSHKNKSVGRKKRKAA